MPSLVLAALSGILLGISFPPSPVGYLALVAFVPVLMMIDKEASRWKRRKMISALYVTFFLYHGITNWWVCSWQENTDPYLFASGIALWLFHPFFLSLPFYALTSIRRRLGRTWMLALAPFTISGFEWIHGQTDASYPWLTSGYMLISTPLAQAAEFVGVYGLTFLIVTVNIAILIAIQHLAGARLHGRGSVRKARAILVWTVGGVVAWLGWGMYLEWQAQDVGGHDQRMKVAVVQPNEDPWDKWSDPRQQVDVHRRMVDSLRALGYQPDVVVWSETAIPFMIRTPLYADDWRSLTSWVDTSDISLLAGYADHYIYPPSQAPPSARRMQADEHVRYDVFNAAMVVNAQPLSSTRAQHDIAVHRKTRLTPFAERLPFADQLTFAMSWIEWGVGISSWGLGRGRTPLAVKRISEAGSTPMAQIGTIICIESIYPDVSSDLVRNGSDILCVITNDAWYNGTWGPQQHYDIARMRAIEQRRTIIRCAMSGVSGFILPTGRSISARTSAEERLDKPQIAPMTQGIATATVTTRTDRTVYSVIGDIIPPIGAVVTLLMLIVARIPALIRKMPVRFDT
jgi:apolipoprotein N-acyltransferase